MKKWIFLGMAFAGCAGGQSGKNFHLTGTINGLDTGTIYLGYGGFPGKRVVDTAKVVNGKFEISDSIAEPVEAYLFEKGSNRMPDPNATGFYIEPGDMTVTLMQGRFSDAKVSGSPVQQQYDSLEAALRPIMDDRKPLDRAYDSANNVYIQAIRDKKLDEKAMDSMKYRTAALHDQYEPFIQRAQKVELDFIASHPQSYVTANQLLFQTSSMPVDSLQMYYDRLGGTVQQSAAGKSLAKEIAKLRAGSPGSMAADFSKKDIHGKDVTLSAYRGHYVLLDFWASWCVPCRKSMPHVKELYEKYRNKGFQVIAISDDDGNPAAWQKAIAKDGTNLWPNVLRGYDQKIPYGQDQPDDVSEKFGIHTLPTKILIDPGGRIVGRYSMATEAEAADLDAALAKDFSK